MIYLSLLTGLSVIIVVIYLTDTHRVLIAQALEMLIRSNPGRYQPASRLFEEKDYTDDPSRFNCLADALDIRASRWNLYHVFMPIPSFSGARVENALSRRRGLDQAFREAEFQKVTFRSLRTPPGSRKLNLVVHAYNPKSRSTFIHVYWLDGLGTWISKPGASPVEKITSRRPIVSRRIKNGGNVTTMVGLYWADPQSNPLKIALHKEAVKAAILAGNPPPPFWDLQRNAGGSSLMTPPNPLAQ